jgi:hypothetical protein
MQSRCPGAKWVLDRFLLLTTRGAADAIAGVLVLATLRVLLLGSAMGIAQLSGAMLTKGIMVRGRRRDGTGNTDLPRPRSSRHNPARLFLHHTR